MSRYQRTHKFCFEKDAHSTSEEGKKERKTEVGIKRGSMEGEEGKERKKERGREGEECRRLREEGRKTERKEGNSVLVKVYFKKLL